MTTTYELIDIGAALADGVALVQDLANRRNTEGRRLYCVVCFHEHPKHDPACLVNSWLERAKGLLGASNATQSGDSQGS